MEDMQLEKKAILLTDLGFLGLHSEQAQIIMPVKRQKNKKITEQQEQGNRWISRVRVKVEHIIASIKIFRKVKEKFRGRLFNREDRIMAIACALHNLKVKMKYHVETKSV